MTLEAAEAGSVQIPSGRKLPSFKVDAYTLEAVVEAGIPAAVARKLLADGPRAVEMRPRLRLAGRGRGPATKSYVWGPDAAALLQEPANRSGWNGGENA